MLHQHDPAAGFERAADTPEQGRVLLGIALSITPFGIAQLVVGYLVVATLAVVVGLAVEEVLLALLARR